MNMKRIRIIAVCLIAACVPSVVWVATASAAPDYGRCKGLKGGKYKDAGCTKESVPGKGKYEWYPWGSGVPTPEKLGFTTKLKPKSTATLQTIKGDKVVCTAESSTGLFSANYQYPIKNLKFEGCSSAGFPCQTAGQATGTIASTEEEVAVLGWINQPAKKVGTDLYGGGYWIEFDCTGGGLPHVKISGQAIAPVLSGKMLSTETVKYLAKGGVQQPGGFEGSTGYFLYAYITNSKEEFLAYEQIGLSMAIVQTNEEKWEINPVV
jgi:hypothetical protein